MSDRLRPLTAVLATAMAGPAMATPPPPPPMATIQGPVALCSALYGLRLSDREAARQYSAEYWVVTTPDYEVGIRSDLDGLDEGAASVTVPDLGSGDRRPVFEWPGNRSRGWIYAFPARRGETPATVRIASDRFSGSDADYPMLRRVLMGGALATQCEPSNAQAAAGE